MKDLVKKVAVGFSTGALLLNVMALPSLATITVTVSGNGSSSNNTANVSQTNTTVVQQTNTAEVSNNVSATATTGGNTANDNTGGSVTVDTGNAKTQVDVKNAVNSNEAKVQCGGCPTDVNATISGNGSKSSNDIDLSVSNNTQVFQTNSADVENNVKANADSGHNTANDNTGGNVRIDTGSATAKADVTNKANANVAKVGSAPGNSGALSLVITGNGANSDNDLGAALSNTTFVVQTNDAEITNNVGVSASTGGNTADDNTGGSVSVNTGNATSGAKVDTLANFNWANVEGCCQFDGLVKESGNGVDSENDVDLTLSSVLDPIQSNNLSAEERGNFVGANADSGSNEVSDSTGTPSVDPSVMTGNATNETSVSTAGNSNVFSTGDALPTPPLTWLSESSSNWFVWLLTGGLSS